MIRRKAQSTVEYCVLVGIVVAAFIVMYHYVYRSMNARLKNTQEEVNEAPAPGVPPHS